MSIDEKGVLETPATIIQLIESWYRGMMLFVPHARVVYPAGAILEAAEVLENPSAANALGGAAGLTASIKTTALFVPQGAAIGAGLGAKIFKQGVLR